MAFLGAGPCLKSFLARFYIDPTHFQTKQTHTDPIQSIFYEKPTNPKSNYAIPGLYFYDNDVINFAESLKPSKRGELEISDLNLIYLDQKKLHVEVLDRGFVWLDTGTNESLHQASSYIETVEKRQGIRISCIEEIAYNLGYISDDQLLKIGKSMESSDYGKYLIDIVNG